MTVFAELVAGGISLGVIYALIALGFVIVYRSTEVINFAQGTVLLSGGYFVVELHDDLGFVGALILGVVLTAVLGVFIEVVLLRPLRRRNARHDASAIVTIGVNILLTTDLTRRIGAELVHTGDPWGNKTVSLGAVIVPEARVAATVVAVVVIAALLVGMRYTSAGLAMRASAENSETAGLCGVRINWVAAAAWAIAGALAALAAVFLVAAPAPGMNVATAEAALTAFPAVVIGGLDSIGGALAGGLVIGLVQSLANGYESQLSFLGSNFGVLAPYVVMVIVLLVRPAGLFGTKALARV